MSDVVGQEDSAIEPNTGQTSVTSAEPDDSRPGEPPEPGDDADETPDSNDDQDAADDDQGDGNANHEAARRRTRFRQAEAERDQLREQVTALQQSIIDQIATDAGLRDPGLLARDGHTLDGLLTEAGTVDADTVRQACEEVMTKYGIARTRRPAPTLQQGRPGNPSARNPADAWPNAFAPRTG